MSTETGNLTVVLPRELVTRLAMLMQTSALTMFDPGTEPWIVLHDGADALRDALRAPVPA